MNHPKSRKPQNFELPKPLGREIALKVLFQADLRDGMSREEIEQSLSEEDNKRAVNYAKKLIEGVLLMQKDLDRKLSSLAENWALDRILTSDRNVMRIGLYEILGPPAVPFRVAIDEAVKLADKYGTELSGKFVNGILHRAAMEGSL